MKTDVNPIHYMVILRKYNQLTVKPTALVDMQIVEKCELENVLEL